MTYSDRVLALLTWSAILVTGLSWLGLPIDLQPRWPVVLGATASTAVGIAGLLMLRQRRLRERRDDVPADGVRELPVVLVVGPYAGVAFSRGAQSLTLRRDAQTAWLYVKEPDDLARAFGIIEQSHERLPVAALLPLIPEANTDDGVLRREFSQWRRALDETAQRRACALPCHIAVYACLGAHDPAEPEPVWFGDFIDASVSMPSVDHIRQRVQTIRNQLDCVSLTSDGGGHIVRAALGQSVLDWLQDVALLSVVAPLANTAPFELRGLLLADVGYPVNRTGAWTRWLIARTGLQPPAVAPVTQPLPLPAVVSAQGVRAATNRPPVRQTNLTAHVVAAVAVVLAVSFGVSGWKNGLLIQRVADELEVSREIPREQFDARHAQREAMERQYASIGRYQAFAEPMAIGWGLYRGPVLLSALAQTIEQERAIPEGVTLDSVALFDSGKTTLRAGATQQLQGVLSLILLNPDKRVLIAGHTDDVGASGTNQTLSEARARVIRDWFVDTAKLPATRFAIQGYGGTRPLANNRDEQGRARNRRVEITLIPDSKPAHMTYVR